MTAAEQPTPPELLAITFVLDSSLAVAAEWPRMLVEYIVPMIKRLTEVHPQAKARMAFVTYGCADTLPLPILAKRFFQDPPAVTKEMRENPLNLGIGLTNGGAGRGMAALEGLVAAIELFERLHKYLPVPNRNTINHIFHIASAPPDDSIYPEHNEIAALDELKWKDIPDELKKRNIHFSSISINQSISQYSELHSAAATPNSPKEPWFTIRPSHVVLLGGFPSTPKAPKRVGDTHPTERTPETKRPRLAERSPKIASTPKTPAMPPKPSPKAQPVPPPPAATQPAPAPEPAPAPAPIVPPTIAPPAQPPQTNPPPHVQPPQGGPLRIPGVPGVHNLPAIVANVRQMENELLKLAAATQMAQKQGNMPMVERFKEEIQKKSATLQRGKQLLLHMQKSMQGQQGQNNPGNGGNNPPQPPNDAAAAASVQPPIPRKNSPMKPEVPPAPMGVPPAGAMGHVRTPSQASGPMHSSPIPNPALANQSPLMSRVPASSPALNAQIQKMMEQRQKAGGAGMPPGMNLGGPQMSPHLAAMEAKPPTAGPSGANMQMPHPEIPQQPPQPPMGMPQPQKQQPVWQGSLCWSGTGAGGKKEMIAHVVATTSNVQESRADTWPSQMTLVPLRDPAVPANELQAWISRTKPVLCGISAQPNTPDPKSNEFAYRTLCSLLMQRNIYASAAWTLSTGEVKNNVIFFPFKDGLVGAFFPMNGVPEPPGSQPLPPPQQQLDSQQQLASMGLRSGAVPAEFMQKLSAMSPADRDKAIQILKNAHNQRQAMMMRQQQQAQAGAVGGMMGNGPNPNNNPNVMNAMLALQQHQAAELARAQQQQQSNHADLAFGGSVPNFGGGQQLNFMNTMNVGAMGMGQPGQPNMMGGGGAGMPRQLPQGMGMQMAGVQGLDPKLVAAYMHHQQQQQQQQNNGGMPR